MNGNIFDTANDLLKAKYNELYKEFGLVMSEKAIKLFKENFANKGDCQGIEKYEKILPKTSKDGIKNEIKYLPWYLVKRIFRLQGGVIWVEKWNMPIAFHATDINSETGELIDTIKYAIMIEIRGIWQDTAFVHHYPIMKTGVFSSIAAPSATELNNAKQRGFVRAIATWTGIGGYLFEGDDKFDEFETKEEKPVLSKRVIPQKKEKVADKKQEEDFFDTDIFEEDGDWDAVLKGEQVKAPKEPQKTPSTKKDTTIKAQQETPDLTEKKLKLRAAQTKHREAIKEEFRKLGISQVSELTEEQLDDLIKKYGGDA